MVCPAVICPYPNTDWGGNSTPSLLLLSSSNGSSDGGSFERWWSKTSSVPLYLLVLLLPLLCFRSAAFFARFTFLGKRVLRGPGVVDLWSCALLCSDWLSSGPLTPPGTLSVIYLMVLVTVKAVRLGFHLDFHWLQESQFYVPGEAFRKSHDGRSGPA